MDIKAILKKVSEGKELSVEEKDFLSKYDPEKDESRIPKSRLDQEIERAKVEKARADKLEADITALNDQIEELRNAGKSEGEKAKAAADKELARLKKELETATKERDDHKSLLAKTQRDAKISALAAKHGFRNSGYLDYLASSNQLDLDDEAAVNGYMKDLTEKQPELFSASTKSGGGSGIVPKVKPGGGEPASGGDRVDGIAALIGEAPQINV